MILPYAILLTDDGSAIDLNKVIYIKPVYTIDGVQSKNRYTVVFDTGIRCDFDFNLSQLVRNRNEELIEEFKNHKDLGIPIHILPKVFDSKSTNSMPIPPANKQYKV